MKRRKIIKNTIAGTAAINTPLILNGNIHGANDRVSVAVIGTGGMGRNHINQFLALENVEVAAICDVDENLFPEIIKKQFVDKGFKKPKTG